MMKYEIKRSQRKTLCIQVYRDQRILIRAPLRCKNAEIAGFFSRHKTWVNKKLSETQQYPGLPHSNYCNHGQLWLLGEPLDILVEQGKVDKISHLIKQLVVTQRQSTDTKKTQHLVEKWKRSYAAILFEQRLSYWASLFPDVLPVYQLKLRKMKRQWGNCNHQGVITINYQLIRYPLDCIDYVLVHELTHLKHLNHSCSFYRLLEKVMRNWQQHKLLLSQFSGLDFQPK